MHGVSARSSHGWRNLIVSVSGGGIKAHDAELEYNGKSYPTNPTVAPAHKAVNTKTNLVMSRLAVGVSMSAVSC